MHATVCLLPRFVFVTKRGRNVSPCVSRVSLVCVCMCAECLGLSTVRVRLSSRFQGHSVDDRALALPSLKDPLGVAGASCKIARTRVAWTRTCVSCCGPIPSHSLTEIYRHHRHRPRHHYPVLIGLESRFTLCLHGTGGCRRLAVRANERERGRVKSILVNYLPGFPTRHTTRPGWLPKAEVIHPGGFGFVCALTRRTIQLTGFGGTDPETNRHQPRGYRRAARA